MYICLCKAVTDREIRQVVELGVTTLDELSECLGVATCCGACEPCAREILQEATSCAASTRAELAQPA